MALIKADRVKETSTSTGATTFALDGAVVGFKAFSSVCSVGDTFYYVIDSDTGSEWETGLGTYSATNTLTRTTVYASSNGGSVVTFSAGTKNIYISLTGRQINTISAAPPAATGSQPMLIDAIGAAHTAMTASTEYNDAYLNLARTVQFSTGAIATQRAVRIAAPTYSFVGASTITDAATVQIDGAPVAGTNATITNSIALRVLTGQSTGRGLVIQGFASQTANLQEWQNSSGTVLSAINSAGSFTGTAANVSGTVAVANGGTGTATGSITGTGTLTFTGGPHSGASGNGISIVVSAGASGFYRGRSYIDGVYVGRGALSSVNSNVFIGSDGIQISTGAANTVLGAGGSGAYLITSSYNTFIGYGAGGFQAGGSNTAIGGFANTYNLSGLNVISIGRESAMYQADGATQLQATSNSVYIGNSCRGFNDSDSNSIVIGYLAIGEGANTTVIGNTSTTHTKLHGYTKTKSILETVFGITDGASVDINPANGGIQVWTLGANRTPTASSFAEGQSVTLMVDDGTAYAITWSSISPTWVGGSAPTLATTGYTVIELWKRSTVIYGALVGTA